ncbi:MAG: hypothetical protein JKY95_09865 [Planctomycetaceae bacterium]|nr:hypothetical protein [Planctomycetaceae bacterium]
MFRRLAFACLIAGIMMTVVGATSSQASAQGRGQPTDWNRFNYYPYIYYPQNFQRYESYDHMYNRYAPQMQVPVYRKDWHNFYPTARPWHKGNHFRLDVF